MLFFSVADSLPLIFDVIPVKKEKKKKNPCLFNIEIASLLHKQKNNVF